MAFKSYVASSIGTTPVAVHTTPAGLTDTLIGLSCSNVVDANVSVTVLLYKSNVATEIHLIKDGTLRVATSLLVVGGDQKVVMEPGDEIRVFSDTATSVDVVLSSLQDGV